LQLEQQLVGSETEEWCHAIAGDLLPNHLTTITLNKLTTGKKYKFRLSAINKAGSSGYASLGPVVCAEVVGK